MPCGEQGALSTQPSYKCTANVVVGVLFGGAFVEYVCFDDDKREGWGRMQTFMSLHGARRNSASSIPMCASAVGFGLCSWQW